MRCLVTAGNTREPIDSVRMWSNIFTGNTGLRIAEALAELGPVDLVTSNEKHLAELPGAASQIAGEKGIAATGFSTHADLRRTLQRLMTTQHYDAVFMTAAVADYSPAGAYSITERVPLGDGTERWIVKPAQRPKIRSTHDALAFLGQRTEKLIDLFRTEWRYRGLLVKFKLEVGATKDQLIGVGQASRKQSGADYLVANALDMVSGSDAGAFLLSDAGQEWVARADLPGRLRAIVSASPKPQR